MLALVFYLLGADALAVRREAERRAREPQEPRPRRRAGFVPPPGPHP